MLIKNKGHSGKEIKGEIENKEGRTKSSCQSHPKPIFSKQRTPFFPKSTNFSDMMETISVPYLAKKKEKKRDGSSCCFSSMGQPVHTPLVLEMALMGFAKQSNQVRKWAAKLGELEISLHSKWAGPELL